MTIDDIREAKCKFQETTQESIKAKFEKNLEIFNEKCLYYASQGYEEHEFTDGDLNMIFKIDKRDIIMNFDYLANLIKSKGFGVLTYDYNRYYYMKVSWG